MGIAIGHTLHAITPTETNTSELTKIRKYRLEKSMKDKAANRLNQISAVVMVSISVNLFLLWVFVIE